MPDRSDRRTRSGAGLPDHPDPEQLAAFQAGDGDRRERSAVEAHLEGCPSCAEAVASVERARGRLALLEEPELPPGLHDRLAAAVAAESGDLAGKVLRPAPWYRRPVAWGAAAALILAALVAVPLLDQSGVDDATTAGGAGGGEEAAQAPGPTANAAALPLIRVEGEVNAAVVSARIDADATARRAVESAAAAPAARSPGGEAATQEGLPPTGSPGTARDYADRSGGAPLTAPAGLQSCLPAATAAADPATRPLVPAFFLEGTYQGRPATVLVTTSTPHPNRLDLWVFPRGNCSAPPLTNERVR